MEVNKQLELRYIVALESFQAAEQKWLADRTRVQAISRYYQDMFHTYKQGQALYIELLDAQQQFTQAQIQSSISKANRQSKWADLERAAIR
jgi:outer membrane protein TolC